MPTTVGESHAHRPGIDAYAFQVELVKKRLGYIETLPENFFKCEVCKILLMNMTLSEHACHHHPAVDIVSV